MKIQFTIRDLFWCCLVVTILITWFITNHMDEPRHPLPNGMRPVMEQFHDGIKADKPGS